MKAIRGGGLALRVTFSKYPQRWQDIAAAVAALPRGSLARLRVVGIQGEPLAAIERAAAPALQRG